MIASIQLNGTTVQIDLSKPIDISIPLKPGLESPNCFYAPFMEITPLVAGDFIGSTEAGSPVNFMNVKINPHGNGTHTECVGHIAKEKFTINQCLKHFFFEAELITLYPQKIDNGDRVITKQLLNQALDNHTSRALIIRTMPNDNSKLHRQYSGTNPPYFEADALKYLVEKGIEHLLIDLPSVDREEDGGAMAAHKAFWDYPNTIRKECTITELIYVPEDIIDGFYLLNLQITSLEMDASPSKPILYALL